LSPGFTAVQNPAEHVCEQHSAPVAHELPKRLQVTFSPVQTWSAPQTPEQHWSLDVQAAPKRAQVPWSPQQVVPGPQALSPNDSHRQFEKLVAMQRPCSQTSLQELPPVPPAPDAPPAHPDSP
jgi:hypothetical protein